MPPGDIESDRCLVESLDRAALPVLQPGGDAFEVAAVIGQRMGGEAPLMGEVGEKGFDQARRRARRSWAERPQGCPQCPSGTVLSF